MTSVTYDLTFDAGGDFDIRFYWKDDSDNLINLTTYTVQMKMKEKYSSTTEIDLTSYVTLGGVNGTIDINIPALQTSQITYVAGVYDLEITNTLGATYKLLRGRVFINKGIN